MLHDPSHKSTPEIAKEIRLGQEEIDVLRMLAEEWASITDLPVFKEKARLWQQLNDLESERPMVWINEIPWHEMNFNNELSLHCKDPWARSQEDLMRKTIYQWKHMPGDMILNPWLDCPLSIYSTDFGIIEDVDLAITDPVPSQILRTILFRVILISRLGIWTILKRSGCHLLAITAKQQKSGLD